MASNLEVSSVSDGLCLFCNHPSTRGLNLKLPGSSKCGLLRRRDCPRTFCLMLYHTTHIIPMHHSIFPSTALMRSLTNHLPRGRPTQPTIYRRSRLPHIAASSRQLSILFSASVAAQSQDTAWKVRATKSKHTSTEYNGTVSRAREREKLVSTASGLGNGFTSGCSQWQNARVWQYSAKAWRGKVLVPGRQTC
ncbi:hypothetical protein BC835DRAFT_513697 [Cytidiella melzeri]|nr:hypothetical protein BC835DRAFT_513697 [Cytidiella melzeri]